MRQARRASNPSGITIDSNTSHGISATKIPAGATNHWSRNQAVATWVLAWIARAAGPSA